MSKKDHKPKPSKATQQHRRRICEFAHEHKLIINPSGYDYYIWAYQQFNHCPCDAGRPECPCPEALEESTVNGYCKCRLFWRSYKDFSEGMIN